MVESTISVQTLGVGIAAFIATLAASFLFINAWQERIARAFGLAMAAAALWGWFGFASAVAADHFNMDLARDLRVFSVLGNVLLAVLFARFAFIYKQEKIPLTRGERIVRDIYYLIAAAFVGLAFSDALFGSATMVGSFAFGAVTPERGVFLDVLWVYYTACIAAIYAVMKRRVDTERGADRRGHVILVYAMTIGASCGIGGFVAWYGIYSPVFTAVRALAMPMLAVGAFYAMSSHNIFNVRVAAANVFVFAIWTFLFFRILLTESLNAAMPDIVLLGALIVLGVLLIRSFNYELDNRIMMERVEKERAIEQAKTEFISIAAHQLRTPLAGIRWTFNLLQGSKSLSDEERDLVLKGAERTKDVVARVNEMLRAARFSNEEFPVSLEVCDVRPIVKEAVALFKDAAAVKQLQLSSSIPRKILSARIDRDKFSIAVQNLIDNAIKYTKAGSIKVAVERSGADIVLRIEDTGIGISSEDRTHLFEKFYRNDKAMKMFTDGSGLGLFIVKKVVDAHGGTIRVTDADEKGAIFTIRVPAAS